jgi:hypothetical protein
MLCRKTFSSSTSLLKSCCSSGYVVTSFPQFQNSVRFASAPQQHPSTQKQGNNNEPLTPTPSRHGPDAGRSRAKSTNNRLSFENAPTTMPPWQRLAKLCRREHNEETRRAYRPPYPKVPTGWQVLHDAGTSFFTMRRTVSPVDRAPGSSQDEEIKIFCAGTLKEPERTFRHDDGEREDPEHLNYTVFISKPAKQQQAVESSSNSSPQSSPGAGGGLEVQLTTVDHELILDAITIHATKEDFDIAWKALLEGPEYQYQRDLKYRGPYVGELDEEFVDEILNYLDERGINNAFASYMQSQWHWFEQLEYEEWLKMYQTFSTPGDISKIHSSSASSEEGSDQEGKNVVKKTN